MDKEQFRGYIDSLGNTVSGGGGTVSGGGEAAPNPGTAFAPTLQTGENPVIQRGGSVKFGDDSDSQGMDTLLLYNEGNGYRIISFKNYLQFLKGQPRSGSGDSAIRSSGAVKNISIMPQNLYDFLNAWKEVPILSGFLLPEDLQLIFPFSKI